MLLAMVVAGALAGAGVLIILRGVVGETTPLTAVVAELHRPRLAVVPTSRYGTLIDWLAGKESTGRAQDLAVCERTSDRYVQDKLVWAALGAAPGAGLLLLSAGGAASVVPPAVLVIAVPVGAVTGWFYARIDLRSDAEKARREFRHALAAYLELVTILMAGGAGVETAMFDAAAIGEGPAFRHLRTALSAAQARREPPWQLLGDLGDRLGISELAELHASMALAGDGAQVRETLSAKAAGIRLRDLAALETEAQARSETMVLPVVLMFAGFLVLIGYPALAALSTS
jgi:Flp pilus assembly protein TadB